MKPRQSLFALSLMAQAAFALFGSETDPQSSLKAAIANRELQVQELIGWWEKNSTKMGNWSLDYETPSSIKPQLQNLYGSLQTEPLAYYRNISGFFWGGWNATDLNQNASIPSTSLHYFEREDSNSSTPEIPSPPPLNSSELLKMHRGTYPWFNKEGGRTFFDINEEHIMPGNVSVIRGSLSLQSNTTLSQKVDFDVDGLHFLSYGSLYLMAFPRESPDATDPRGILGMIPSSLTNLTVSALNKSMETRIQRLNQQLLSGTENESGDSDGSSTEPLQNCTLQIYGHLTSVGGLDLIPFMDQVEHELRHPNGATFSSPIPPLQLSSVIYSPDCKFSLDSPLNRGLRSDAHQQKVVRYALVLLAVQLFQSYLITRQMDKTRTPSALAKVSYLTFVFQGVLDFFSAISHLAMGVVLQNSASMPLIAAAFVSTMLCLAFLHRYVLAILNVTSAETTPQAPPSPPVPAAVPAPAPATDVETDVEVAASNTEAAATEEAAPEAPPAARREFGRGRRAFSFGCTTLFLFLLVFYPQVLLYVAAPLVYSLWIPQIIRNSRRGTRKALRHRYIIGTTLCRLFIPLYFFACPYNTLFQDPNPLVWILVLYVSAQALLLLLQDFFGPNFFLPKSLRPGGPVWEWHPLRSEIKKKTSISVEGDVSSESDPQSFGDCAICLAPILTNEELRRRRRNEDSGKEEQGFDAKVDENGSSSRRRRNQRHKGGDSKGNWTLLENESDGTDEDEYSSDDESRTHPKEKSHSSTPLLPTTNSSHHPSTSSSPLAFLKNPSRTYHQMKNSYFTFRERVENQWDSNGISVGGNGKRVKEIMITPCNHAAHSSCLQPWLEVKAVCPTCRASLPLV